MTKQIDGVCCYKLGYLRGLDLAQVAAWDGLEELVIHPFAISESIKRLWSDHGSLLFSLWDSSGSVYMKYITTYVGYILQTIAQKHVWSMTASARGDFTEKAIAIVGHQQTDRPL